MKKLVAILVIFMLSVSLFFITGEYDLRQGQQGLTFERITNFLNNYKRELHPQVSQVWLIPTIEGDWYSFNFLKIWINTTIQQLNGGFRFIGTVISGMYEGLLFIQLIFESI